jgi:NTE family protein
MAEREPHGGTPGSTTAGGVGLVLGGGGTVGTAYHSGVLAALHHDLGWDARSADVVVGTSAGSLIGGLLRVGVPPDDLAAMTVGARALGTPDPIVEAISNRPEFPPFGLRHLLRRPRILGPSAVAGLVALSVRHGRAGLSSLAMLLPDGSESLSPHLGFFESVLGCPWPADPLLVCAARTRDCRRTVFGQGGKDAPLADAVAASCAVPGYFSDVRIGRHTYVDGGVISASNADVLKRHDLSLAIVVSPMTSDAGGRGMAASMRRLCRRALDREIATLEQRGIHTVVIQPGADVLEHVTTDFMSDEALVEIVRAAFLETGQQVLRDERLALLGQDTGSPRTAA